MSMNCLGRRFLLHLTLASVCMVLQQPLLRAKELPLLLKTLDINSQRLVIYAGINGGAPKPYLFDTGSAGFNAAYYDGPITGNGTNTTNWTFSSTISTNATVSYGGGLHYNLNAVTVSSIEIYDPHHLSVVKACLTAPGNSAGFTIGQVTNAYGSDATQFTQNLQNGLAPLDSGLYGTFGAGMFVGLNTSGSNSYLNASVLGQASVSGWAVVANAASPRVYLGLDSFIRSQFDSAVPWNGLSVDEFPITNANSGIEYGDGIFDFTLSGNGAPPVQWTQPVMLDTGTANNLFNAPSSNQAVLDDYYYVTNGSTLVGPGFDMEIKGHPSGSGTYDFVTDDLAPLQTSSVTLNADNTDHSTIGIGFFLNKSVAFDLENMQTLYTSNTVIPEPSALVLLQAVLLVGGLVKLRRRS